MAWKPTKILWSCEGAGGLGKKAVPWAILGHPRDAAQG